MKSKSELNMEIEAHTDQCEAYKDQIYEANQILDEIISILPKGKNINTIINTKEFDRLREALK